MGELRGRGKALFGNEVDVGQEELVEAEEEAQVAASLPTPICLHSPNGTITTLRMLSTGVGASIA